MLHINNLQHACMCISSYINITTNLQNVHAYVCHTLYTTHTHTRTYSCTPAFTHAVRMCRTTCELPRRAARQPHTMGRRHFATCAHTPVLINACRHLQRIPRHHGGRTIWRGTLRLQLLPPPPGTLLKIGRTIAVIRCSYYNGRRWVWVWLLLLLL